MIIQSFTTDHKSVISSSIIFWMKWNKAIYAQKKLCITFFFFLACSLVCFWFTSRVYCWVVRLYNNFLICKQSHYCVMQHWLCTSKNIYNQFPVCHQAYVRISPDNLSMIFFVGRHGGVGEVAEWLYNLLKRINSGFF